MLSLRKPTVASLRAFMMRQAQLDFTYAAVGATAAEPPTGYALDHCRVRLGEGEAAFAAACAALRQWQQFNLGWVEARSPESELQVGTVVVVVARALGLWWMNACRIIYLVNEAGPTARFGFAYGTLPAHAASGEERFLIEWNRSDGGVWFDILAFSRPRHILARLGYPMVRHKQEQFRRQSSAAMARAVRAAVAPQAS